MISVWRGYHSSDLPQIISKVWEKKQLLILLAPTAKDFSFLKLFPEIEFLGEWADLNTENIRLSNSFDPGLAQPELQKAAFGLFTSGTQSFSPRLVFYSRENILFSLAGIRSLYDTGRIKKIFCFPQPTHTFGFILGYLHTLLFNLETIALVGPYSRKALQFWFDRVDETTLTLGTPTHFVDLLGHKAANEISPRKSYSAIIGGATVTKSLWSKIQEELNVEQPSIGYGATEASPGITHLAPGVRPLVDGDVGSPIRGVHLETLPEGIRFSGANVCLAIYENFKLSFPKQIELKDKLVQNEGRFHFAGRSDLIVNRGGLKFSLEKIENFVQSKFGYKNLAVDVYDPRLGREIYLLVQSDEGIATEEIHQHLLESDIKILKENIIQEKIPLNANFKFDRQKARRLALSRLNLACPVSTKYLEDHLPHRHSAIWVDEIVELDSESGQGLIRFDAEKAYATEKKFRPGSCVEFIGQTYGYVVVMQDILKMKSAPSGKVPLIVEVKNIEFSPTLFEKNFNAGEQLIAEVRRSTDFGQLKIIKGKVTSGGHELASMELKIFVT